MLAFSAELMMAGKNGKTKSTVKGKPFTVEETTNKNLRQWKKFRCPGFCNFNILPISASAYVVCACTDRQSVV